MKHCYKTTLRYACQVPRPRTHDEALRSRLLDRAGELVSEQGPRALTLRALAADAGTSTSAVYALFGGKPGLLRALYLEAFRRFHDYLCQVTATGDAADDLFRLGLAYRRSALADPHLYAIMFTRPAPDFEPDAEVHEAGAAAFGVLLATVRRGIADGTFTEPSPERLARAAWALVHGLVSLELSGNLATEPDPAREYEEILRTTIAGWRDGQHAS